MKKYLLTGSMIVLFMLYLAYQRFSVISANSITQANSFQQIALDSNPISLNSGTNSSESNVTAPSRSTTKSSATSSTTKSSAQGIYKDGTYIGVRADAYYGYIQVEAVVSNGKLADVQFLEHPSDQRQSIQINTYAMPQLRSEAISAQSANVDIVSRATDSSMAFRESLAAALAQAKS